MEISTSEDVLQEYFVVSETSIDDKAQHEEGGEEQAAIIHVAISEDMTEQMEVELQPATDPAELEGKKADEVFTEQADVEVTPDQLEGEVVSALEAAAESTEAPPPVLQEEAMPAEKEPTPASDLPASEPPHPAITKVLSATQIEDMFHLTEQQPTVEAPTNPVNNEEDNLDLDPQVTIEDIKAIQDEVRDTDILVCGSCHSVYHFLEEFTAHKPVCKKKSDFHGNAVETKPQVWAFLLWKNQLKTNKRISPGEDNSWKLYQKWCRMPDDLRNVWVTAGESVMNLSTFGSMKPSESSAIKHKKVDFKDLPDDNDHKPVIMKKLVQRDAAGEIREIKSSSIRKRYSDDIENIRSQLEDGDSSQDRDITGTPATPAYTGESTLQEEEFIVEKIVSRRFNPRRKQYEYLLKWEGYPSEQNTWEPAENLESCQHLLRAFEESLAKQAMKQKQTYKHHKYDSSYNTSSPSTPTPTFTTQGGRPIRSSKQKALNQVKQWCGSIKPDDAELEMLKRKVPITDSDEDDDPYTKKMKMERESDSEDSVSASKVMFSKSGKSGIIRKPGRPPLKKITNGTTESLAAVLGLDTGSDESKQSAAIDAINRGLIKRSTGMSPHNQQVLVANAKGVVKVDPSQVPNLSSGVYIMSNKSGIIKLDSVSPSKALSLKGVIPSGSVKELGSSGANSTSAPSTPSVNTTAVSTPASQSGVVVVNKDTHSSTTPKSGIMRRPGVPMRGSRPVGRPPSRGYASTRMPNPNTRLIHSGQKPNFVVSPAGGRPRGNFKSNAIEKKPLEGERKILGPKTGRGGYNRGGIRGGRGGSVISSSYGKSKDMDSDHVFLDIPHDNSNDSDQLVDLFRGGKGLMKTERDRSPEPTPPQSPKSQDPLHNAVSEMIRMKDGSSSNTDSQFLKINSQNTTKDPLVKKTLKPGSIGSMSVSPKKSISEDDEIVTVTGEDGVEYKIKKSELASSLLVGEDGEQCVYVTAAGEGSEEGTIITLDPSYADSVGQLGNVNILGGDGEGEAQFYVKEGADGELVSLQVEDGTNASGEQDQSGEDGQSQVVAQLLEASEPEPGGGPRRVVLLLPDGNIMMTEVDEEQYAALELDKHLPTENLAE